MKIAVAGKGGVGKTTISAGLILWLAEQGRCPLAVDADPNNCLGYYMGLPDEITENIRPLSDMREVLAERAGTEPGRGGLYALSPPVTDLIEDYMVDTNGLSLLVMGTVTEGGQGCLCPENSVLKTVLRELVDLDRDMVVDLVAGLEHLGRGTVAAMDGLVVVTDATRPAIRTVERIRTLAEDIDLTTIVVIGNKVANSEQRQLIADGLTDLSIGGYIPAYYGQISQEGVFGGEAGTKFREDIARLAEVLQQAFQG